MSLVTTATRHRPFIALANFVTKRTTYGLRCGPTCPDALDTDNLVSVHMITPDSSLSRREAPPRGGKAACVDLHPLTEGGRNDL